MHTALFVGEAHFQQGGDETAGTDVVSSHNPSLVDKFLYGIEAVGEIGWFFHCRHIVANPSE